MTTGDSLSSAPGEPTEGRAQRITGLAARASRTTRSADSGCSGSARTSPPAVTRAARSRSTRALSVLPAALVFVAARLCRRRRRERLRAAPRRPPEPDRQHGDARAGDLRQRVLERARSHAHDDRDVPPLGDRDRAALPGRLRTRVGHQRRDRRPIRRSTRSSSSSSPARSALASWSHRPSSATPAAGSCSSRPGSSARWRSGWAPRTSCSTGRIGVRQAAARRAAVDSRPRRHRRLLAALPRGRR